MGSAGQGLEVLLGRASAPEARLDDDGGPGRAATASRARGEKHGERRLQKGALNSHRPVHRATEG
jgi:hypothetical protein